MTSGLRLLGMMELPVLYSGGRVMNANSLVVTGRDPRRYGGGLKVALPSASECGQFKFAARKLGADGVDLEACKAQCSGGVGAIQGEVDAIAGGGAEGLQSIRARVSAARRALSMKDSAQPRPPHAGR